MVNLLFEELNSTSPKKGILNISILTIWIVFIYASVISAQNQSSESLSDLKKEILLWQTKIAEVKDLIKNQENEISRGKQSFASYQKRDAMHRSSLTAQVDSLRRDLTLFKAESDSISRKINTTKNGAANLDLRREQFRLTLTKFCDQISEFLTRIPPGNISQQRTVVEFLKGELETHSVNESEALERIWQILNVLATASQSIDVYAAPSPLPQIKGQVFFIRMGFVFLGVISDKGEAGAVWTLSSDSTDIGTWNVVEEKTDLKEMWKAVLVRERRAIPELVSLPLKNSIEEDNIDNGSGVE